MNNVPSLPKVCIDSKQQFCTNFVGLVPKQSNHYNPVSAGKFILQVNQQIVTKTTADIRQHQNGIAGNNKLYFVTYDFLQKHISKKKRKPIYWCFATSEKIKCILFARYLYSI